jgi:protease I
VLGVALTMNRFRDSVVPDELCRTFHSVSTWLEYGEESGVPEEAHMAKKIAVLLDEMVNEQEFIYPYYRLREAGFESVSVATEKRVYKGKYGVPFTPDMLIGDVTPGEFDGVVVPGGYAPDFLRRIRAVLSLVGEMNDKGKLVAMICHAGWVGISAGIVKGRTLTSTSAIRDDMSNAGASWVDQSVVVDGNLVTSRAPADLPDFMREVLRVLSAQK